MLLFLLKDVKVDAVATSFTSLNLFCFFQKSDNSICLHPDFTLTILISLYYKNFFMTSSRFLYPLSVNPTKWSNTLKQFVGCYRLFVVGV